jgi:hypothetical protein
VGWCTGWVSFAYVDPIIEGCTDFGKLLPFRETGCDEVEKSGLAGAAAPDDGDKIWVDGQVGGRNPQ